jgi:hypothetical protein
MSAAQLIRINATRATIGRNLFALLIAALMSAHLQSNIFGAERAIDFSRDIRPILSDKCFQCHGPDAEQRQADLRLDLPASATAELESGFTAIVPRDPARSELVRRIYADESEQMPPADSHKSLTDAEKALLTRWIAESGEYTPQWSFVRPKRPQVPEVADDGWSRNEIDRFVFARLRSEELSPSPEADRRTLIRRVSLDLTGLPPSIDEVEAFLADDRPDAYERLVDRLLASPRYGERMAVHWLDLARYADSDGYEKDGHREMWPFRDWVIKAFNDNMPFDEFTVEQLAGDSLPEATREQRIASAFNRNNPTTSEAGSDPDEFAAKYAVDRATTTARVWFGLTMQCAECHDHKFDPITTEDFYRMFAFFNQVPEVPLYDGIDCPPTMTVATPEDEAAADKAEKELATAKEEKRSETEIAALQKRVDELRLKAPRLRIMQDVPERRPTYILVRGNYRNRGKEVSPGIPAALGKLPTDVPTSRLVLARWLVSEENPLTARVVVNRLWSLCFGVGLVATIDDFGSQGEWPSHPELLDWLATEFISRDWDIKTMLRLMVTSSTYRQSSAITPDLVERDPQNKLLARGPRHRLPAEMVRDNVLAISGLLHEQLGGPSVYPYQPSGLWEEMAWADSPWKTWPQSHGPDLYRRGLYTFWKRSVLHPVLAMFDAPNRNLCVVDRSTTNTPLQVFATLNETSFVEAARALATRITAERHGDPAGMVDYAYRLALARPASSSERDVLLNVYCKAHERFSLDPASADALLAVGEFPVAEDTDRVELAAWTTVTQVILNLDETLTKE